MNGWPSGYWVGRGFQRAKAALRAICCRFLAVSLAALAGPPFLPPRRPSATAAGFFSPVASRRTRKAVSFTSSLRLRLLERLGMVHIRYCGPIPQPATKRTKMPDQLDGIRLKMKRAKDQVDSLRAEIEAFGARKPYGLGSYFDADARELSVLATVREAHSGMWGVMVGEILHNLRSSLDQLVWQLVILETGLPPTTTKTGFPIYKSEAGYDKASGAPLLLHGVGSNARALIKSMQPFSTGENIKSPLWQLREVSNFDKHRTLHVTSTSLEQVKLTFPWVKAGITYIPLYQMPPGPFKNGALLYRLGFTGTGWPFVAPEGSPELQVQGNFRGDIAFDQGSPEIGGAVVIPALLGIGSRVYDTIKRIATDIFKLTL